MSGSNSNSSQMQVQEQADNRIAAAENSVNLVMSRSEVRGPVTVTSTDHDSVAKSFDFATAMAAGAASASAAAIEGMSSMAQDSLDAVKSAYDGQGDQIAAAYGDAKSGEQKVMVAGALAVLGVVALQALKSKG